MPLRYKEIHKLKKSKLKNEMKNQNIFNKLFNFDWQYKRPSYKPENSNVEFT